MIEVVIGIDLGTQGARILAVTADGRVAASAQAAFPTQAQNLPAGWFEQSPQDWWNAVKTCLRELLSRLPSGARIAGLSVDSTSGTILAVDSSGEPLYPAIMYNDRRSEPQVPAVQTAGVDHQRRHGFLFGSSFALPKMAWFRQKRPDLFARTARFVHAADFIVGKLTGSFTYSDTSNALKTGYDLLDLRWPAFIADLGIAPDLLPEVVLPGAPVGHVTEHAAGETGLKAGIPVYAGATDGTAAQIASGAANPGDWNATLGTTLVLKGISSVLAPDPLGRVYSHRHPQGWWMPGGASNTGAEWIVQDHPGEDPRELDRLSGTSVPTRLLRYPLCKRGERFPFLHNDATGFLLGESAGWVETYAAGLEGVAFLERLAYDVLRQLGLEMGENIFITGGGSKSLLWSQIRASVLDKVLVRPTVNDTAMGAAMLAASGCWYPTLSTAAKAMGKVAQRIEPVPAWQPAYQERYRAFVSALASRGYITP